MSILISIYASHTIEQTMEELKKSIRVVFGRVHVCRVSISNEPVIPRSMPMFNSMKTLRFLEENPAKY